MIIFVYCVILFVLVRNYPARWSVGHLILCLYLSSSIVSVIKLFLDYPEEGVNNVAVLYYIICVLLFLYPYISFGSFFSKSIDLYKPLINKIAIVVGIFGFIELAYAIPQLFTLQTLLNNLSDVRNNYYSSMSGGDDNPYTSSLLYVLAQWVHYIQFLSPFCCVYYYVVNEKSRSLILFVASLSYPLNNMIIGEREASFVFLSNYLFCILLFKDRIDGLTLKRLLKYFVVALFPIILFIIGMTISRFEDSDGGIIGGLLVYGGEQPFNFSYFFTSLNIEEQKLGGRWSFGYLFPENEQLVEQLNYYISSNKYLNVFAGAPGSFLLDFGYYAIFYVFLFSLFFCLVFHSWRGPQEHIRFSLFFVFYLLYQVEFMNIFYYDFTSKYQVIMVILTYVSIVFYEYRFIPHDTQPSSSDYNSEECLT